MAIAHTRTLLPLDRWAQLVGFHPLHFNQIYVPDLADAGVCGQPLPQYAWQGTGTTAREDIANAIKEAEDELAEQLGYTCAPDWITDDAEPTIRAYRPEWWTFSRDLRGYRAALRAQRGQLISGGQRADVLIQSNAPITYSDPYSQGYASLATVGPIATTVTDVNEISVRYPGENEDWEIRPITVVLASGFVTITFAREQCVIKAALEILQPPAVNGTDSSSFLTTCDVYHTYNDPSVQSQLVWRDPNLNNVLWADGCSCGGGGCVACGLQLQNGCLNIVNAEIGYVAATQGTWDPTTQQFDSLAPTISRQPDRVRMWYYAGFQNKRLTRPLVEMDHRFEEAIAKFSLSKIDHEICGCDNVKWLTDYWGADLALSTTTQSTSRSPQMTGLVKTSPFGTRRGAVYAWGVIRKLRNIEG